MSCTLAIDPLVPPVYSIVGEDFILSTHWFGCSWLILPTSVKC